jgi:hypothetical protein
MLIRTRMCMSADGCVTTPDRWPVQVADPAFVAGQSYGFPEFQASCDAVLMGRTTFEPALSADRLPWPNLEVFVLGSHRPAGTPDHVVFDSDPARLLRSSARPTAAATSTSSEVSTPWALPQKGRNSQDQRGRREWLPRRRRAGNVPAFLQPVPFLVQRGGSAWPT